MQVITPKIANDLVTRYPSKLGWLAPVQRDISADEWAASHIVIARAASAEAHRRAASGELSTAGAMARAAVSQVRLAQQAAASTPETYGR